MNDVPALLPALPEILLALGAMALLMVGVFRGDQSTGLINGASIALLVIVGFVVIRLPEDRTSPSVTASFSTDSLGS
jgi:NADH-quinone oxidoreductase subunit N